MSLSEPACPSRRPHAGPSIASPSPGDDIPSHAVHAVGEALDRIARREPSLRAFVHLAPARAMAHAARLDRLAPAARGPLHALPLAVKELFEVQGLPWSAGSALYRDRLGSVTAPMVAALEGAGAVVLGMSASSEFAIAELPRTVHPLDPSRGPGASSSGSAAAVGAGLVPLALGTQTLGSIIRPAAYCGAVGFKPSHARYSMLGVVPLSESLDDPGLLADSAARLCAVDEVLAPQAQAAPGALAGLCLVPPWFDDVVAPVVRAALGEAALRLRGLAPAWRETSVPPWVATGEAQLVHTLLVGDLARLHGEALRGAAPGMVSARLLRLLGEGEALAATRIAAARQAQQGVAEALHEWLRPGEVAVTVASVDVAPQRGQGSGSRAPQRLWSLAGMPALCLPMAVPAGSLPIGIQFVARQGEDRLLLEFAARAQALLAAPRLRGLP